MVSEIGMKRLLAVFLLILPWRLRRIALIKIFGYQIHPTARIGFSLILPVRLEMDAGARIEN